MSINVVRSLIQCVPWSPKWKTHVPTTRRYGGKKNLSQSLTSFMHLLQVYKLHLDNRPSMPRQVFHIPNTGTQFWTCRASNLMHAYNKVLAWQRSRNFVVWNKEHLSPVCSACKSPCSARTCILGAVTRWAMQSHWITDRKVESCLRTFSDYDRS